MAVSSSADIAQAINRVLHLDPANQGPLLDTIEEYFTPSDEW